MNKYMVMGGIFFLFLLADRVCPAVVEDIDVKATDRGVVVSITTDATSYREVRVSDPPRIVIDFPGTECSVDKNRIDVGKWDLIAVRAGQFETGVTRVVLDLKRASEYNIQKTKTGFEVLLVGEKKIGTEKKKKEIKIEKPKWEETFVYSTRRRRDPFRALVGWASEEDTLPDVRNAQVVGIVWSPEEKYALIQASDGEVYILEEGDRVRGGKVSKIGKKNVVFTLWELGRTERLTLRIKEKESR